MPNQTGKVSLLVSICGFFSDAPTKHGLDYLRYLIAIYLIICCIEYKVMGDLRLFTLTVEPTEDIGALPLVFWWFLYCYILLNRCQIRVSGLALDMFIHGSTVSICLEGDRIVKLRIRPGPAFATRASALKELSRTRYLQVQYLGFWKSVCMFSALIPFHFICVLLASSVYYCGRVCVFYCCPSGLERPFKKKSGWDFIVP